MKLKSFLVGLLVGVAAAAVAYWLFGDEIRAKLAHTTTGLGREVEKAGKDLEHAGKELR